MDPKLVAQVLSEIAEASSETMKLQDVFGRIAESVRKLIPLDKMGVVRMVDANRAVMHAATFPIDEELKCVDRACSLEDFSPRIRPQPRQYPPIVDAAAELDPKYPMDAMILEGGMRSSLWQPFFSDAVFTGGVWIDSYKPNAFGDEHQQVLRPIAALLGSAVEHWRIWDAERRRRNRLDELEKALGTLAESLDIREVFEQLSLSIKSIIPHDMVYLGRLDEATMTISTIVTAGEADIDPPDKPFKLTTQEADRRILDFDIINDIPATLSPSTERNKILISTGMRSWLKVPVRLSGEIQGSLGFFHREAQQYSSNEGEVARRIADRVALMMSHQRLAEEARTASEALERALRLEATVGTLMKELESRGRTRIIGTSHQWKDVLRHVGRVSSSDTTVLITGESGTGKEVVSHLIHQGSPRNEKPFVAINCAALPEQLLESELFGHEKGAFTGAVSTKIGRIEQAAGGSLFLDEIAEMSPLVQAKFLRVLQEREFQRLGGERTIKAEVRVIAATNQVLASKISRGEFREDLYYRLNVFEINIPSLRERPEDILPLAEAFLQELGAAMGRPAAGISREGRDRLLEYPWPGNVRELRNAIERAILLCDGGLITRQHLPINGLSKNGKPSTSSVATPVSPESVLVPGNVDLSALDKSFVEKALSQAHGNKSKAARLLGLSRAQFYTRLEKYNLR
ncbi:MAG TPA: sigma-54-dependent Fis family transcriptional regulator [candidate division Zixibacteria bacterium]|nr:sigma-54-dependent Fis family transcriptional regulator [candidate division Zixibacteria bacterium]